MGRNKESDSASSMVEGIFGDRISPEQKQAYEKRLRENYLHRKNEDKIPENFRWRSGYGERQRSHLPSHAGVYYENLLLLDTLLGRPGKVFEIMGIEGSMTESERSRLACDRIRIRRAELQPLLEHTQALFQESQPWENLPDDFDLYRSRLSGLLKPSIVDDSHRVRESWKFPFVEEIQRLEDTEEWQMGEPEAIAEVAMLYHRLGSPEVACRQIDDALRKHPADSGLNLAKAFQLMNGAAHHFNQLILHDELGAGGGAPISGEEQWHAERAADEAETIVRLEQQTLVSLIECYLHLDETPPRWMKEHHDVVTWLIRSTVFRSVACIQQAAQEGEFLPTSLKGMIDRFLARVRGDYCFRALFYRPDRFQDLLRFWQVARICDIGIYEESFRLWFEEVGPRVQSRDEMTGVEPCLFKGHDFRFQCSWADEWPSAIVEAIDDPELSHAFSRFSVPGEFRRAVLDKQAWQSADRILWKAIQFEWRRLLDPETRTPLEAIKVCEDACGFLPWSDSPFSVRWRSRWRYSEARCHFDAAMHLAGGRDNRGAAIHVDRIRQLLEEEPRLANIETTHFLIFEWCDDFDSMEELIDLTGSHANIFSELDLPSEDLGPRCMWPAGFAVLWESRLTENCRSFRADEEQVKRFRETLERLESYEGSAFDRLCALIEDSR